MVISAMQAAPPSTPGAIVNCHNTPMSFALSTGVAGLPPDGPLTKGINSVKGVEVIWACVIVACGGNAPAGPVANRKHAVASLLTTPDVVFRLLITRLHPPL